jgi:hypothetical protein
VNYLKEDPELLTVPLESAAVIVPPPGSKEPQPSACRVATRLGGLLQLLVAKTGVEGAAVIAVWLVESGGRSFTQKKSPLRLEVHQLFDTWGKRTRQQFDLHFRFGGHNLQPGQPWENQEFRTEETGEFHSVHHNQRSEYAALTLAQVLAGAEEGLRCASIGGCQIMMNSFGSLGYSSAQEMYTAFQESERAQVLGFFDFCQNKLAPNAGDLLNYLRAKDWANFAKYYNGPGQVAVYLAKLQSAYQAGVVALRMKEAA